VKKQHINGFYKDFSNRALQDNRGLFYFRASVRAVTYEEVSNDTLVQKLYIILQENSQVNSLVNAVIKQVG
jgi:homoserine trans-succinylase